MMIKPQLSGSLLILLAVACGSIAPVLVKVGLAARVDPVTLLTLRLVVAAAIFWGVFGLFWPDQLRIDWRGLVGCAAVATASATALFCFYWAMTRIAATVGPMIFSLFPLVVLLLLALRGEPIRRRSLVRLGLGILGVYLLIGPGGRVDLVGALLAAAAAVAYALHLTLGQVYLSQVRPQTMALYVVSFMALIVTAARLLQPVPWQMPSLVGWGVILGTGLISTVAARLALFAGIQRIGSGQTALLGPIETALTVLWATLFLGEQLSPVQWAGGLSILVSALLAV
jgi:drug/metabolite transporter (DMT)-like permease